MMGYPVAESVLRPCELRLHRTTCSRDRVCSGETSDVGDCNYVRALRELSKLITRASSGLRVSDVLRDNRGREVGCGLGAGWGSANAVWNGGN